MRVSVAPPVLEFRAVTVSQLDLQAQTSYQFLSEWAEVGEGRLGNVQAKGCTNAHKPVAYVPKV